MTRAGWAHDTPSKWGKAAGFAAPKNSTYSLLQRGMIDQPKPLTFYQLGLMNDRLARKDYGVITDKRLRLRVQAQEPICTPEGRPWGSIEFFSHFMGLLDPPTWAEQSPEPTAEDAKRISEQMIDQFQEVATKRMLSPMQAFEELSGHCLDLTRAEIDLLRSVLSGWHVWTPEELVALSNSEAGGKVWLAIRSWAAAEDRESSPELKLSPPPRSVGSASCYDLDRRRA